MAKKRYHEGAIITQPSNNRANLPQEVIIKDVPPIPSGGFDDYDDTMSGIDKRLREDSSGNNRKGKAGRW